MRAALMLIAMSLLGAPSARADAALEARVLRLEAQVKALQESLKNAVQVDRLYSFRTANGQPDFCLSSRSTDASEAAKAEPLLGKCDQGDNGPRSWKIVPAQH